MTDRSDSIALLMTHNLWAMSALFDACDDLTSEQFHQRFEIGPGSLHDATTHIVGSMRRWHDRMIDAPMRTAFEGPKSDRIRYEVREIRDACTEAHEALGALHASLAQSGDLDSIFVPDDALDAKLSKRAAFLHVATHAVHHRAQCLNMLRHLGAAGPSVGLAHWADHTNETLQ